MELYLWSPYMPSWYGQGQLLTHTLLLHILK
jgi:hypothetical protein